MNEIVKVEPALPAITNEDARLVELFLIEQTNPHTRRAYTHALRLLFAYLDKPLATVTRADAIAYRDHLRGLYRNLYTVKLYVNVASAFFGFATSAGYLGLNAFAKLKTAPAPSITHKRILSEEDVLRLIDAPTNQRDKLILRLLYAAGLRASELCALRWDDLSADGVLHVQHGKGDKERFITLSEATHQKLVAWRGTENGSAYIFPRGRNWGSRGDAPISRVRVHQIIKDAAQRAGINPDASAHWLRHSHGSHALDRGASVVTVRDTLGHASINTTNKYLHGKRGDSSALKLAV
jgi:site-specific recombinase XerD